MAYWKQILFITASVISSFTFFLCMNPPGGIFKSRPSYATLNHSTGVQSCEEEAVLVSKYPESIHFGFLLWSTICFLASVSVCVLLISIGTRMALYRRFSILLFLLRMCVTITIVSLPLTCLYAASMSSSVYEDDFGWRFLF